VFVPDYNLFKAMKETSRDMNNCDNPVFGTLRRPGKKSLSGGLSVRGRRLLTMLFLAASVLSWLSSCNDLLEVEPENTVSEGQMYRNRFDADAAVIGIYGKLLGLADRYVILNELRADLLDITTNADASLRDLNEHQVTAGNPYADPRPFYEVIHYCNDVLKNFEVMKATNRITEQEFNERYSDIGTLRSWLYFQLSIHWGEVPYITEPFETLDDLDKINDFPRLTIEQMVTTLIAFQKSLPSKEMYPANSSLRTTIDGYSTWTMFINKKFFLGDLYLWNGEYNEAAKAYKEVMLTQVPNVADVDSYKIRWADVSANNDLAIGYLRYKEQDHNSLIDNNTQGWKSMFIRAQDDLFNSEWIWVLPFNSSFNQGSPFVDIFSNAGGKYLIKPSQLSIDMWNAERQRNDFPWDQRGRFSYSLEGGQPAVKKHTYNFDPLLPLQRTGKWFLARAALLHLRFAEAANRDEQHKLALALLNPGGIRTAYNNPTETDIRLHRATFLPIPYDFDARQSDIPLFRDTWHRHDGIRGRAYLYPVTFDSASYFDMTSKALVNKEEFESFIEDALIKEAALELAFEGNRWADLIRVAIRRNDPSFLANKIADKLQKAGNPNAETVRSKLASRQNWFLPFE
jgi:hypothetical protein